METLIITAIESPGNLTITAAETAETLSISLSCVNVVVGTVAPANPTKGDLWINTGT